jgi:hypothetical protein
MDPYLEADGVWPGFHHELSVAIKTQLIPALRPNYHANVEVTISYDFAPGGKSYTMRPDVAITNEAWYPQTGVAVAIAPAPIVQAATPEVEVKLLAVHIYTTQGKQLVTSIEIHSPANKISQGQNHWQYLRKRRRLLNSAVHLLELDLLRAGSRLIMGINLPTAPYFAALSRAKKPRRVEIWPMFLGQPLPVLPVPLLDPDPDVPLDLNTAIATVYDNGGYDYILNYQQPPPPPLTEAERALIKQITAS